MTEEEIQAGLEREREDSKAHGARLIETYAAMQPITDRDSPDGITMLMASVLVSCVQGLEDAGYVATEPAELKPIEKALFPTKHTLEDGTEATVVGYVRATMKGYRP